MRTPSPTFLAVALAVTAGLATPAVAQPATPPAADLAEAQSLYDDGKRLYNLGEFERALTQFEAAYAKFRAPEFLFNIGQCYRNLRRWEKAIFVFESYLREKPDASSRPLVEQFLAEMRVELERQQQQEAEARASAEALARRQREAELEVLERRKQAELDRIERERAAGASATLPPATPAPRATPIHRQWWFWTVVGVAAVGATGGLLLATGSEDLPGGTLGTIDAR